MSNFVENRQTPAAEVEITEKIIRGLLQEQFPQLADRSIRFLDAGWDNEMYKLGKTLVIRMPRRKVAVKLLENERRWLPELAKRLPISIPSPVYLGSANKDYPWIWNIIPWYEGETANLARLNKDESLKLADFLKELHQDAPKELSVNNARLTLMEKHEDMIVRMNSLQQRCDLITDRLRRIWQTGIDANHHFEPKFIHADLHPKNILVQHNAFTAVIDWGDMTCGDISLDLASFWTILDTKEEVNNALQRYKPDENQISKAKAWAVFMGVIMLDTGLVDNPTHAAIGKMILDKMDRWEATSLD